MIKWLQIWETCENNNQKTKMGFSYITHISLIRFQSPIKWDSLSYSEFIGHFRIRIGQLRIRTGQVLWIGAAVRKHFEKQTIKFKT